MNILGNALDKFVTIFIVYFEYDGAVEVQRENAEDRFCVYDISSASQIHIEIKLRYYVYERLNAFGSVEQQSNRFHTNS